MLVLDTNVISALMLREPDAVVRAWLDNQPAASVWTTSITVFEIRYGIERLPARKRRDRLGELFDVWLRDVLAGRVLAFDTEAAGAAAKLAASNASAGKPNDVRDVQIAGVVSARRATLATRNVRHFEGAVPVVNPWGVSRTGE